APTLHDALPILRRRLRGTGAGLFHGEALGAAGPQHVVGMQEGRALEADVDERRLHARHHPLHAALVDVADDPAAPATLDVQLLEHAVLDHRDAGLARGHVDQDLLAPAPPPRGVRAWMPNSRSGAAVSCRGRPITPE